MKGSTACNCEPSCKPKACEYPSWERHDETSSASPINHHHLIRSADFSLRLRDGLVQVSNVGTVSDAQLPAAVAAAVKILLADLAAAPFASPDADRLRHLGLDLRAIAAAERAGLLLRVSDQIVLAPGADALAGRVLADLPQPFTAADARQALQTTRRVAIPLLEFLDRAGVTERLPDDRRRLLRPPTE